MSHQENENHIEIFGPSFSTFVRSIMLLCEEYSVNYSTGFEFNGVQREYKSKEHLAIHPFAKFPVIKHGDFILAESASICRYLTAVFDNKAFDKVSLQERAHLDAFCALLSTGIDKAIIRDYLLEFSSPKGEGKTVRLDVVKRVKPQVQYALSVIENELMNGSVLGKIKVSMADCLVAPMLHYLSTLPPDFTVINECPTLIDYLNTLMKKTHFKKILVSKP